MPGLRRISWIGCVSIALLAGNAPVLLAQNGGSAENDAAAAAAQTWNGEPILQVGGDVQPPIVIHSIQPKFSEEALAQELSGAVVVNFLVDRDGIPQRVRVLKPVGKALDESAVEAIRQYRFKPATQNGRAVVVEVAIKVNFLLLDE